MVDDAIHHLLCLIALTLISLPVLNIAFKSSSYIRIAFVSEI